MASAFTGPIPGKPRSSWAEARLRSILVRLEPGGARPSPTPLLPAVRGPREGGRLMKGATLLTLLLPRPGTCSKSAREPKWPRSRRHSKIPRAKAGPTPGRRSSSLSPAVLMSILSPGTSGWRLRSWSLWRDSATASAESRSPALTIPAASTRPTGGCSKDLPRAANTTRSELQTNALVSASVNVATG